MGTESKGKAWFGKIYNKLETILVEVDTFTSQSTLCLNSTDPEEVVEDQSSDTDDLQSHHDRLALPSCESPSDPPLLQNFDISGNVRVEENGSKENSLASSLPDGEILSGALLLQEYCNGEESVEEVKVESWEDFVSTEFESIQSSMESFGTVVTCNDDPVLAALEISMDDSNLNPIATKILEDDVINGKSDVAPLDTNSLYDVAFREDPSYVDDNALYAVRVRTKKLRSFKRKILDALTSKRRREKEYEQLAIWFGDADMGSDLPTGEAIDSKTPQVLESEDSQWEIL